MRIFEFLDNLFERMFGNNEFFQDIGDFFTERFEDIVYGIQSSDVDMGKMERFISVMTKVLPIFIIVCFVVDLFIRSRFVRYSYKNEYQAKKSAWWKWQSAADAANALSAPRAQALPEGDGDATPDESAEKAAAIAMDIENAADDATEESFGADYDEESNTGVYVTSENAAYDARYEQQAEDMGAEREGTAERFGGWLTDAKDTVRMFVNAVVSAPRTIANETRNVAEGLRRKPEPEDADPDAPETDLEYIESAIEAQAEGKEYSGIRYDNDDFDDGDDGSDVAEYPEPAEFEEVEATEDADAVEKTEDAYDNYPPEAEYEELDREGAYDASCDGDREEGDSEHAAIKEDEENAETSVFGFGFADEEPSEDEQKSGASAERDHDEREDQFGAYGFEMPKTSLPEDSGAEYDDPAKEPKTYGAYGYESPDEPAEELYEAPEDDADDEAIYDGGADDIDASNDEDRGGAVDVQRDPNDQTAVEDAAYEAPESDEDEEVVE